jgi:hypothetical protein
MNRRTLIRDSLMALGIALLPKILRPMEPEVFYDAPKFSGYINDEPPKWAKEYDFVKTSQVQNTYWVVNYDENGVYTVKYYKLKPHE